MLLFPAGFGWVRFGSVPLCSDWFGSALFGSVSILFSPAGSIRFGSVRSAAVRSDPVRSDPTLLGFCFVSRCSVLLYFWVAFLGFG